LEEKAIAVKYFAYPYGTFKDFSEYWYYVKKLTKEQRDAIFNSLSSNQQEKLKSMYSDGGWEDLFIRDILDNILDGINKDYKR
jgi:hypothetical protein